MSLKEILIPTLNHAPAASKVSSFVEGNTIPRIIHQTFYSRSLPPELAENVARIKALNPTWDYRFYDDADILQFIEKNYPPAVLSRFNNIDIKYGAARADLFRYLLMYRVGGVYLDIKSLASIPLDTVLRASDRFVLSSWKTCSDTHNWGDHYDLRDIAHGEFQQWHIVCAPGHKYMRAVIDSVLTNIDKYLPSLHGYGKYGVLRVTGPIAYTRAIHTILDDDAHRLVDSVRDLGFKYNVYTNQSHETIFKSHYSLQTNPIIKLGLRKRQVSRFYGLMQFAFDLFTGRRKIRFTSK